MTHRRANVQPKKSQAKGKTVVAEIPSSKCHSCKIDLEDECKSLQCNLCDKWFCIKCLKISDEMFDTLNGKGAHQQLPVLMIGCETCQAILPTLTNIKGQLQANQSENVKRFDDLDSELKKMKEEIKNEIVSEVNENFKVKLDKIDDLEVRVDSMSKVMSDRANDKALLDIIDKKIRDNNEVYRRKKNLMVYNLQESDDENLQVRVDYDTANILRFFHEIDQGIRITPENIVKVIRVGKKNEERARPTKVILDSVDLKYAIVSKYRENRAKNVKYGNLNMAPDYTPSQRASYLESRAKKAPLDDAQVSDDSEQSSASEQESGTSDVEASQDLFRAS